MRGVVSDRGVRGPDAAVDQGEDGLVVAFPLISFALMVGAVDRVGAVRRRASRNMARLRRLLPAWETCSARIDEPDP